MTQSPTRVRYDQSYRPSQDAKIPSYTQQRFKETHEAINHFELYLDNQQLWIMFREACDAASVGNYGLADRLLIELEGMIVERAAAGIHQAFADNTNGEAHRHLECATTSLSIDPIWDLRQALELFTAPKPRRGDNGTARVVTVGIIGAIAS